MGVRVCKICNEEHDYKSGFFTRHLVDSHDMTLEDYVILTEYNNEPPKCECGLCDDKPQFFRGKFRTHASGHRKFNKKKELYLKKYGDPMCPTCGELIEKWYRGEPRKYCKKTCTPNHWNQNQVNMTVKERYGVDNVFQLDEVKDKSKETSLEIYGVNHPSKSEIIQNKIRKTNIKRYGVECVYQHSGIKDRIKEVMLDKYGVEHPSQINKNRISSSKRMIEYNKDWFKNNTIKKYKDTDLYYQSSYELDFLELCERNDILHKVRNGNSYNISESNRMLTDFSIGNYEIEIKSTYVMEKQGGITKVFEKRDSVLSMGNQYIFILDKDYTEFINIFNISL